MGDSVSDFRSDAYALSTPAISDAMVRADAEWIAKGSTGHLADLEARVAALFGKQAAMFVPTCTMANLLALMSLGERGTSVLLERDSHMAVLEDLGSAYVCGLQARRVSGVDGILRPDAVAEAMQESRFFDQPRTSVVALENTHNSSGGSALWPVETAAIAEVARRHGARVHIDGARIFNAALALGVSVSDLAVAADTVSVSLNKGLRAPVGAMLSGDEATISAARRGLKHLGGGTIHSVWRFAAGALVALDHVNALADDNRRARSLAEGLVGAGVQVRPVRERTNIVLIETDDALGVTATLAAQGVLVKARSATTIRFVTHGMIGDDDVARAVSLVAATVAAAAPPVPRTR